MHVPCSLPRLPAYTAITTPHFLSPGPLSLGPSPNNLHVKLVFFYSEPPGAFPHVPDPLSPLDRSVPGPVPPAFSSSDLELDIQGYSVGASLPKVSSNPFSPRCLRLLGCSPGWVG